ncbi:helix-turn-helix domain-containing protein (plasmid) [Streptomyces sp. JL4002]|uniref:helix-turn-helix domain-containing protein n=1 Tax=Streptomyces sp. JL4002 TaxID=3404781 RepID=UPI003B27C1CA
MSMGTEDLLRLTVAALMTRTGERQNVLAESLGLSQAQISRKQAGRQHWSLEDVDGLAAHFGLRVLDLLAGPTHAVGVLHGSTPALRPADLPPLCFSRSCNGAAGLRARYDCVPSVDRMTWGVVSPGPAGAVGDADERPGHRPARRNAGAVRGRQVCITWMREQGATAEAGTVNTCGRVRC